MASIPKNECCETCKWWITDIPDGHPPYPPGFASCRRWPPSNGPVGQELDYLVVRSDFWCGEYKKD